MNLIKLTEVQFKNYSKIHSKRNYCQTLSYGNMMTKRDFETIYLGLIDDKDNLIGATMILCQNLKAGYKFGYAPRGFLIDFNNKNLLTVFTNELKKYLTKIKVVFVKIDPPVIYQVYDNKANLLDTNDNLMDNMVNLGYYHLGFNYEFEANFPRYNAVLYTNGNVTDTYKKIRRNVKRNINISSKMGISIHKGSVENIELFYSMIRKKTSFDLDYYKDFFKYFNDDDNIFELYFAKINPKIYVNNYHYLQEKEANTNYKLSQKMQDKNVRKTKKLLAKKMLSDNLLVKYRDELVKATNIFKEYPNGLVVASCGIIRNNREIYIIEEGHEDKLKNIYANDILRWEIIKKYMNEGYKMFNLGGITGNFRHEDNPYYGLNFTRTGFGGNIIEYPGEFDLIINKPVYKLYFNVMYYKNILADKFKKSK